MLGREGFGVRKKPWLATLSFILLTEAVGSLSALLSGGMELYESGIQKPPLSPPGWLFPVVWTLLYLMMGLASYRVCVLRYPVRERREALRLYALQLLVNVLWPPLFFRFGLYWAAAVWLAVLTARVAMTLARFRRLDDLAGLLLWPYLLWCCFALYLNAGVALLN